MKRYILMLVMMAGVIIITRGQSPVADPDTIQEPIKQIDPELKQLPHDAHYAKEEVRINADELPVAVLDTLKKLEPTGWEKSVVYKNKKNGLFTIEIRESGNEKVYKFHKDGRLVREEPDDE